MSSTHKDLLVWQESMELSVDIYRFSKTLPASEKYGLASQMQRAVTSIPANIAEGAGRNGRKEFSRFINIARGSASELETHLELCHRLGYLKDEDNIQLTAKLSSVGRLLTGLAKAIQ
jgi:four helix bundle protein